MNFIFPNYWGLWLLLGLLRFAILLPRSTQLNISASLGMIMFKTMKSRKSIAKKNIAHCFPEKTDAEIESLVKAHFRELAQMPLDTATVWWKSNDSVHALLEDIQGVEHVLNAQKQNKPVLLLSGHFTGLDISGAILSQFFDFSVTYRRADNPLLEKLITAGRKKFFQDAITKKNTRGMIQTLKKKGILWLAPDQSIRGSSSITTYFFGHPCYSTTAIHKLAKLTGAVVIPYAYYRKGEGYSIKLGAPLPIPSHSEENDALIFHKNLEAEILEHPEQYYWVHRKFNEYMAY